MIHRPDASRRLTIRRGASAHLLLLVGAVLAVGLHGFGLALGGADRRERERGDVPGWVLITLMTAGLVTTIWALAGDQLGALFTQAISSVTGPGKK